jgi:SpoVK/Ycf46/Vps4 family AAA+-type ATPase
MTSWLGKLFDSFAGKSAAPASAVDPGLVALFRTELKHCETLYQHCGERIKEHGPSAFHGDPCRIPALMADLHRGVLLKIFTEMARCDRQWDPKECALAVELFRHVWNADVGPEALMPALENVTAHSETLKWESLLRPFVNLPGMATQRAELLTIAMRVANLLAKANGEVLADEAAALRALEETLERELARRSEVKKRSGKSAEPLAEGDAAAKSREARSESTRAEKSKRGEKSKRPPPTPPKPQPEMLAEAMRELEGLIGLGTVKKELTDLAHFLKVQLERRALGLQTADITLHMLFYGNPGTGKTTVARIVSRILGGLGILGTGNTIETDRSGLVAEYVGQTGPKVNRVIDDALDGVLFIDEAYSLAGGEGKDQFGAEAVQTLLKRMEDDRKRLVVILAGYTEPMDRLIRSNPGLSSRFQRTIDFPDYSASELLKIFEGMCDRNHYVVSTATCEKLRRGLERLVEDRDEHFGNARLVRNIFEQAIRRMAVRIVDKAPLTRELLTTLEPDDIVCRCGEVAS